MNVGAVAAWIGVLVLANTRTCTDDERTRAAPVPGRVEAVESVGAPEAPSTHADDAPIDLLHATRSTVVVSSVYRGDVRQAHRLVDGDPTTAWNSATGDLEGAWIDVEVPTNARVAAVQLTVGFTRSNGTTDLFTGNHRIAEVEVIHGSTVLGRFALDVSRRDLQTIPVTGGGGTYRLRVTRTLPGSRTTWREAIVSELRVLGSAPGARVGSHTPAVRVAAEATVAPRGVEADGVVEPSEVEADTLAANPGVIPPTPGFPLVDDALYVRMLAGGLARLVGGRTEVLLREPIVDFALSPRALFVLTGGGRRLIRVEDGMRHDMPLPSTHVSRAIAVDMDGNPVVADLFDVWRWTGRAWRKMDPMDTSAGHGEGEQPQDLVFGGPHWAVWALGQDSIFLGSPLGEFRRVHLPARLRAKVEDVDASRNGYVAAVNRGELFVRSPSTSWRRIDHPSTAWSGREVAVGTDGTVVGGGFDGIVVAPPYGTPFEMPLVGAGIISALAIGPDGRLYVGATTAFYVVDGDRVVYQHRRGLAGFEGTIVQFATAGRGVTELPVP